MPTIETNRPAIVDTAIERFYDRLNHVGDAEWFEDAFADLDDAIAVAKANASSYCKMQFGLEAMRKIVKMMR